MKINVLVELKIRSIDRLFTYNVPVHLHEKIKIGVRVKVPFANQKLEGFVVSFAENSEYELKDIDEVVDEEIILTEELFLLGDYLKEKTLCTLISAYQAMLPKALKASYKSNVNKKYVSKIRIINHQYENLTEKDRLIIEEIKNGNNLKVELNKISSYSVKKLLEKEVLKEEKIETYRLYESSDNTYIKHKLNEEQEIAVKTVIDGNDQVYLLHGVTGSGKTEVYLHLIKYYLSINKTAIMLVPEISLTPQMVSRFKNFFQEKIAVFHSRLSEGEKYDEYRRIRRGEVNIVIGTRSAIFTPLNDIGVIIIDEEHTTSYKQDNNPKYHALDIAIKRSEIHNCKIVLGSATPSLESYSRAVYHKYRLIELKNRANNKSLPSVNLVDMSKEKKTSYFSRMLVDSINDKLSKKEQIILLLNRRGYASFISCNNCDYVSKCPNCDISLTYHKSSNLEVCHYCGYAKKNPIKCPQCHEGTIRNLGVGTEKIEEELNKRFNARVIRMDYDTTSTKGSHERIIDDFYNHKYDILLGTQMIAKGFDFPNVTLVGVINADTSLLIPNFRSSENTFQLLSQVAGRSGRSNKEGMVIVQTYNPKHYAINLSKTQDYQKFFQEEMFIRQKLHYPPFFYLVTVKIIGTDYDKTKKESEVIKSRLVNNLKNSIILGPAIGNILKFKNKYHFVITIKYKKDDNLYPYLEQLLDYYSNNSKVSIDIDFNPYN